MHSCFTVVLPVISLPQLIGTRAEVFGVLDFNDNNGGGGRDGTGIDGGAIYTTSFSQIFLHEGANISLVGNTGV